MSEQDDSVGNEIPTAEQAGVKRLVPGQPVSVKYPISAKFFKALDEQRVALRRGAHFPMPDEMLDFDRRPVQPGKDTLLIILGAVDFGPDAFFTPLERARLLVYQAEFERVLTASERFSQERAYADYCGRITKHSDVVADGGSLPDEHQFPTQAAICHEYTSRQKVLQAQLVAISKAAADLIRPVIPRVEAKLRERLVELEECDQDSANCFGIAYRPGPVWKACCTVIQRLNVDKLHVAGQMEHPKFMLQNMGMEVQGPWAIYFPKGPEYWFTVCLLRQPEVRADVRMREVLLDIGRKQFVQCMLQGAEQSADYAASLTGEFDELVEKVLAGDEKKKKS